MGNYISQSFQHGNIEVVELLSGEFQKSNTRTAVLKQKVTIISVYQGAKHSNNMQDNVFSSSEFGDDEKNYTSVQNRVAFLEVPASVTLEQVREKLSKFPEACLYRVYSYRPILHDGHQSALDNGLTTLDKIAMSQVLRYGAEHANAGEIILHNGHVQYGKTFFSTKPEADKDLRGLITITPYRPDELKSDTASEGDDEDFEISDQVIE